METRHLSYPVLTGSIILTQRPSFKLLDSLKTEIDTVVTLQWDHEFPFEISEICSKLKLQWIHLPIKAVNLKLISNSDLFNSMLTRILNLKTLLESGHKLLIHCAGGIHRTGFTAYTLLRLSGISPAAILTCFSTIRPLILVRIGKHRLELAEKFYEKSTGIEPIVPYFETFGRNETDFIKYALEPLVWLKVKLAEGIAKIEFCMTSFDIQKISIGGEVFGSCEGNVEWRDQRRMAGVPDKVREISECEEILMEFITSCTDKCLDDRPNERYSKGLKKSNRRLAGMRCFYDKEFLMKYMPNVLRLLDYRIIDLSTFEELAGNLVEDHGTVYSDIQRFIHMKNRLFVV